MVLLFGGGNLQGGSLELSLASLPLFFCITQIDNFFIHTTLTFSVSRKTMIQLYCIVQSASDKTTAYLPTLKKSNARHFSLFFNFLSLEVKVVNGIVPAVRLCTVSRE